MLVRNINLHFTRYRLLYVPNNRIKYSPYISSLELQHSIISMFCRFFTSFSSLTMSAWNQFTQSFLSGKQKALAHHWNFFEVLNIVLVLCILMFMYTIDHTSTNPSILSSSCAQLFRYFLPILSFALMVFIWWQNKRSLAEVQRQYRQTIVNIQSQSSATTGSNVEAMKTCQHKESCAISASA